MFMVMQIEIREKVMEGGSEGGREKRWEGGR